MKNRRLFLALLGVAALAATSARAFDIEPYQKDAADKAIASGKPVVIEIYASWCPICQSQSAVIEALKDKPAYRDIMFYRVDFDAQKDVVKALKSPRATIIVYRNGKEVGRESWGSTQEEVMRIMMKATS
jgi:thiol-disulfide isomerase/thioredoxin